MTDLTNFSARDGLSKGQRTFLITAAAILGVVLAFVLYLASRVANEEQLLSFTQSLNPGGWMAWVLPTALFFWTVAAILLVFTWLAMRYPETPRRGIFGFETTRGDRLFISLLAAGYINLAWLGLTEFSQWIALGISIAVAAVIFRLA